MDFLEYGMRYEKSDSKMQRMVAKCLLAIEKRRADLYEERLNRSQPEFCMSPEETAALYCSVQEKIARLCPKTEEAREDGANQDADHNADYDADHDADHGSVSG